MVLLPSRGDLDTLEFILKKNDLPCQAIADTVAITTPALNDAQIDDLMVFLEETLADYVCLRLDQQIPLRLSSGLPVFD